MDECDCCDIPLKPIYGKKGSIIDFQCTSCGKLNSEILTVYYSNDLSIVKGGNENVKVGGSNEY